jgi:Ca2+-binding RTX toxin-like protein
VRGLPSIEKATVMTTTTINLGSGQTVLSNFKGAYNVNSAAGASQVDILKFVGAGLTAQNLIITQSGADTLITFEGITNTSVRLVNFIKHNLDNDIANPSVGFAFGNIMFDGQNSIGRELDILDPATIMYGPGFTPFQLPSDNAVTFLNNNGTSFGVVYGYDLSNDIINGGNGNDAIAAKSGDDILRGNGGADSLVAGAGNDRLFGGNDNDWLYGDQDDDVLYGNNGVDYLYGGYGNDRLYGGMDNDGLSGYAGDDYLYGGNGNDRLDGDDGNDFLYGDNDNDVLYGQTGADKLYGGLGDDFLSGGLDNDFLYGSSGADILRGDTGDDTVYGEAGADFISGDWGLDLLYGGDGDDQISGGDHADKLYGGTGNDTLNGDAGDDFLYGGTGNDIINGGSGYDVIYGEAGDDRIAMNGGDGKAVGGSGVDWFIFDSQWLNSGGANYTHTISDFNAAAGEQVVFKSLGLGDPEASGTFQTWFTAFVSESGGNTSISGYGTGSTITLLGVDSSTLTAANFSWVA